MSILYQYHAFYAFMIPWYSLKLCMIIPLEELLLRIALAIQDVGECVTAVVLQRHSELWGSQNILRTTIEQLWRLELQ